MTLSEIPFEDVQVDDEKRMRAMVVESGKKRVGIARNSETNEHFVLVLEGRVREGVPLPTDEILRDMAMAKVAPDRQIAVSVAVHREHLAALKQLLNDIDDL